MNQPVGEGDSIDSDRLGRGNPQISRQKNPVSALQMLQSLGGSTEPKLDTGCPILNRFLKGGLPRRGILEVSGSSGSAKTQLCLQISLTAQSPIKDGGLGGAVAYLCTEGAFPIKRLHQIISERQKQFEPHARKTLSSFSDNLFIECVSDMDALEKLLTRRLPILVRTREVKLVIVDSVAALFRCEFDVSEMAQRARKLYAVGAALTKLNAVYGTVIVCVNQVSDVFSSSAQPTRHNKGVTPALGLAWSNIITTRIMLSRTNSHLPPPIRVKHESSYSDATSRHGDQDIVSIKRKFQVVFSPNLEPKNCDFFVDASGVHGVKTS